jgi:Spy/CpxP family protein refolding chaperone
MKRTLLAAVLSTLVLFGTSALAQTATPPEHGRYGAHGRGHNEFAGLNLTTEQKSQIRTIHQEERTKMETLNKESHTRAEFRTQSMAIRKEGRDKIVNGVLTGEQRAQLLQREQQRQQRYKGNAPTSNQ